MAGRSRHASSQKHSNVIHYAHTHTQKKTQVAHTHLLWEVWQVRALCYGNSTDLIQQPAYYCRNAEDVEQTCKHCHARERNWYSAGDDARAVCTSGKQLNVRAVEGLREGSWVLYVRALLAGAPSSILL